MGYYEFNKSDAFDFANSIGAKTQIRNDELQFKLCPYCKGGTHNDKYTFAINLKTGAFNCRRASCMASGNMIRLSKDFDFSLGRDVDEYYKGTSRFRVIRKAAKPESKDAAVRYMKSRGISEETCRKYNITVRKDNDKVLVFPFYDENDVLTFVKYRKTDFDKSKGDRAKEWCEAKCKPILFGMNHIDAECKTLVLTEGQIDSLSVAEAGVANAVSVPTGAKGFTWIPFCWDFLQRFDTLIVFGDCEGGKITLLDEMAKRFNGAVKHVREADYQGCKDANELLTKHGIEAVRAAVQNAVPLPNPHIKCLSDVKRIDFAQLPRITTGISQLDKVLGGFFFGQLVILTGRRGDGKSTLGSQFGAFALSAGYSVMYYSGELADWHVEDWLDRQIIGPDERYLKETQSASGYKSYSITPEGQAALDRWYEGKAYIYDSGIINEDETESEILVDTLEKSIKQFGCKMLIVDNLMTAITDDLDSDLYRRQSVFVKRLAKMAKTLDVVIILIVHPRKNDTDISNDDVMGSSNITNLADVTMVYARASKDKVRGRGRESDDDTDDYRRYIRVMKNRLTGELTRNDGIEVFFEPASKRISERRGNFEWDFGVAGLKTDEFTDDVPDDLPFD